MKNRFFVINGFVNILMEVFENSSIGGMGGSLVGALY